MIGGGAECNNKRNKLHNKCNVLESFQNLLSATPLSIKNLSSTPDAKNTGDCCMGSGSLHIVAFVINTDFFLYWELRIRILGSLYFCVSGKGKNVAKGFFYYYYYFYVNQTSFFHLFSSVASGLPDWWCSDSTYPGRVIPECFMGLFSLPGLHS